MATDQKPFARLTPDRIIDAVESTGVRCDGRILALNSYENRVYQVGLDEAEPIVAKFYRPGRWTDAAIREEHAFTGELAGHEIPVVSPLVFEDQTLFEHEEFRFAMFPRQGGHWPELESRDDRLWLGRYLGRIHAVGSVRDFRDRPTLEVSDLGHRSVTYLLEQKWIPSDLTDAYQTITADLMERITRRFEQAGAVELIRLQGDCHPGNVLWTDDGPHFVDFDDCRMGPAIQDIWMFLSGEREEQRSQLASYLVGYAEFHDFEYRQLLLLESLRTLRIMHYSAWLARRWGDPAFPLAFPWFNTIRYWQDHVLALREQAALLDEPPLEL